jgi:hypothetical protein
MKVLRKVVAPFTWWIRKPKFDGFLYGYICLLVSSAMYLRLHSNIRVSKILGYFPSEKSKL